LRSCLSRLLRGLFGVALVLLATARSGAAYATPLPPGVKASRPCDGPPATDLPLSRSVDAFTEVIYNLDFGSEGGQLSQWLTLRYEDGLTLYVLLPDLARQLKIRIRDVTGRIYE
jgi:hypothetical protein